MAGLQRTQVGADAQGAGGGVDLAQHRALAEEERLLGVDDRVVEVVDPRPIRSVLNKKRSTIQFRVLELASSSLRSTTWFPDCTEMAHEPSVMEYLFQQVVHDLVGVAVVRVGEQEDLGAVVAQPLQQHRQPVVAAHQLVDALRRHPFHVALCRQQQTKRREIHVEEAAFHWGTDGAGIAIAYLHVDVIDGRPHVLEHGLVRHEQVAQLHARRRPGFGHKTTSVGLPFQTRERLIEFEGVESSNISNCGGMGECPISAIVLLL